METLLKKLSDYRRFLELQNNIPYWEAEIPELSARIREMSENLRQKEVELIGLENPNFFQKVLGKAEARKEKCARQIREITAARMAAQWEQESLAKKITAGKLEQERLAGSREVYETAKAALSLTAAQESQLMMAEISAFAPAAMETAGHLLEALANARTWMQEDAVKKLVGRENRKMEYLSAAEAAAVRLCGILSVLPEGIAALGPYLREPRSYIDGVTSEFKQLDRLNSAMEQVQTVCTQLRLLLGE